MKFVSKRDWWISIILLLTSVYLIGMTFINTFPLIYRVYFILLGVLIIWIYTGTFYVLSEEFLVLRCGPLKVKIPYEDIEYIKSTRNLLSSVALSTDKIKIKTKGKGVNVVYISPLDKEEFIKQLKEKCIDLKILD